MRNEVHQHIALATLVALAAFASAVHADAAADVACTYAPSQSRAFQAVVATAGGAAAATSAVTSATGLVAVAHSSGAYIFTGSAGYVAGTLGAAGAAPVIVIVGALIGGAAISIELVCAPRNHPEHVAQMKALAYDYLERSKTFGNHALEVSGEKVSPVATAISVRVHQVAGDVFAYARRLRN